MLSVYLFGAHDCQDCAEQKDILNNLFGDNYFFINIESEDEEDLLLMSKYEIDETPTVVIIKNDNGKERKFRHCGVISESKLKKFINKI
jgi:hypothetical protein